MPDSASSPQAQSAQPTSPPTVEKATKVILPLAQTIARALSQMPIGSPCTGVCRADEARTHCVGCFRTLPEIKAWKHLDDDGKRAVIGQLAERERTNRRPETSR